MENGEPSLYLCEIEIGKADLERGTDCCWSVRECSAIESHVRVPKALWRDGRRDISLAMECSKIVGGIVCVI